VIAAIIAYAPNQKNRARIQWAGIAGLAVLAVVLIALRILQLA
jgi:high-affinity Fe2+/Pb2+ permease